MKKILFGLSAFAMMFATSCQNEPEVGTYADGTAQVIFAIGTPEMDTRTFSDGATATVLQYAVYDAAGNELTDLTVTDAEIHGSTTVDLQLTTGNTYSVIFWAAAEDAPYTVNFSTKTMTVDYANAVSNDESRDAFYKYHTFTVSGAQTETVELKRPFAQLNIGTSDYDAAEAAGYDPEYSYVKVPVYNTLDLVEGKVSTVNGTTTSNEAVATEFKLAAIPDSSVEPFPVAGYEYLLMNYLLVPTDKEVVDIEFGYSENSTTVEKSRIVGSVPVQRNHRTNIYGQLLTSDVGVNLEIKPGYDDPALELDELHKAALNGGEVTLSENVVLTTPLEVVGNMTINLNGKTISNASDYAIENYGSLTINGDSGQISGMGGIRSHGGNLTINGGNYTGASDWNNGTYQHILKAENTEVVINGGTFDANIGGITNAMINVSNGSKVTINGGEFRNVSEGVTIPNFAPYMFTYEGDGKLIINNGEFYGGWRFNGPTTTTDIYGGNFTVSYDGQSFHASSTHVLTIYGGTFSLANGGKLNPTNYVADGYTAVDNGDNTWTVCKALNSSTISTVFENLSTTEPTTIAVTENINIAEPLAIPAGAEVTVNLGDKEITSATTDGLVVNEGATLTISGNGTVKSNGAPIRAIGGTVIVEGGTFTQTGAWNSTTSTYRYSVDSREGGEVIIKGGTFNTNNGLINVSANSSVVIDGGEFTFENNTGGTRHFAYVSGVLTINDGVFRGVADSGAGGCFFCGAASTCDIQVNGGKFTSLWTSGGVNKIFESYAGGSKITVTGGLFNSNGGITDFVEANTDTATSTEYPYVAK